MPIRGPVLDELGLDGRAWRTPPSVQVERTEDFVARVEELGLEGVVAKRLCSNYIPGRRWMASVKHKLRLDERLAVTGVRCTSEGLVEAIFVALELSEGSLIGAGSIELGLRREPISQLEQRLAELPQRRRGRASRYPAEVSVTVSVHGLPDRLVRDAILRRVVDT